MMTVVCPHCRHRFPAPGCCETNQTPPCFYGGLLVPRGFSGPIGTQEKGGKLSQNPYIPENEKFIQNSQVDMFQKEFCKLPDKAFGSYLEHEKNESPDENKEIVTQNMSELGSVTVAPSIQSGGRLIRTEENETLAHAQNVEIQKLSGGGCFVEKKLQEGQEALNLNSCGLLLLPPSGCQELPGTRRNENPVSFQLPVPPLQQPKPDKDCFYLSQNIFPQDLSGVHIQVNATVQLPASLGQCTLNITATANPSQNVPRRNNFNGGGLVQENESEESLEERRTPSTPVSWLMPCPWNFDCVVDSEVRRVLQSSSWYHEGLSWQQSEKLLENTSVGHWLMRDSSDSRFAFAISVQTSRGPTSVRVHHFMGQFRLDAEPRMAFAMPLFDCPIRMLEHYVKYSKSMDERREVWVDYSGQVYSEIYLTRPLVKEVRTLSHLARLVVNSCKLPTNHLPPMIKNYLAEYPYTL